MENVINKIKYFLLSLKLAQTYYLYFLQVIKNYGNNV